MSKASIFKLELVELEVRSAGIRTILPRSNGITFIVVVDDDSIHGR